MLTSRYHTEYAMLMAAQLKEQQQWQRQHTPSHSRQSSQSGYYHPTTTQQTPFQLPHMVNAPINRPSTAPPQQLRSVLAPPQSPERYRVSSFYLLLLYECSPTFRRLALAPQSGISQVGGFDRGEIEPGY